MISYLSSTWKSLLTSCPERRSISFCRPESMQEHRSLRGYPCSWWAVQEIWTNRDSCECKVLTSGSNRVESSTTYWSITSRQHALRRAERLSTDHKISLNSLVWAQNEVHTMGKYLYLFGSTLSNDKSTKLARHSPSHNLYWTSSIQSSYFRSPRLWHYLLEKFKDESQGYFGSCNCCKE